MKLEIKDNVEGQMVLGLGGSYVMHREREDTSSKKKLQKVDQIEPRWQCE